MSHPGSGGKAPAPQFSFDNMAKKINNEETPQNLESSATPTVAEQEAEKNIQNETLQPQAETSEKSQKQSEKQTQGQETSDPHILELLKKFPRYPTLYIGNGGSTFSPDTAPVIRGKAVLYKNPYFNQSKSKS